MIKYTLKSASKIQNFLSRKTIIIKIASILLLGSLYSARAQYPAGSPVAINGKLKLVGNKLSNECGNPVQLRGMSSHGIQWFGNCYNTSALDALANSWKVDLFRLAMYVQEGGYVNNPNYWKTWIDNMVDECGKRGIYCLIDWHVLTPGDPNVNLTQAREFWTYMSARHSGKKHVLYEICNEPNGVDWTRVKAYADDIIPRIRANDPATVIIVGTPNWSQDVDIAANNKLNYNNIMYALHFYTGTHTDWLRTKANTAMSRGIALFVTEFGTSLASGDGGPFLAEGQKWMDWMAANNISWANWSFCDKAEVSAALNSGACGSNWNNTSTSGTWIKQKLTTPADNFNCGGTGNQAPAVSLTTPSSGTTYTAPATITINATASDVDGNVAKVEFYSGATKLGEDLSSPYSYGWTHVPAGTYSIRAVAVDNLGATSSTAAASVTVTNNTVNKAPVVSITSPALGTSFDNNSNITFNAAASDPDGSITKVEFYNGTTKIGEDLSAPYAFTWRKVSAGTYYITAKATDNNGQTATSAVVVIKVGSTTGNVLPNVAITSPTAGSVFNAPAVINLAANATDVDGTIAKVEFYNGSVKIGEDLSSPYTYTWTGVMAGTYTLYAKAIDNIGGSASSQSISITVNTSTHTGCTTQAIPVAAEWQLRNPWSDQSNGSLVSNTAEALSITHRQYGMDQLWLIQTGKTTALQAGKTYNIQFDFSNHALAPIDGIEVGFASVVAWDGPVLTQPAVVVAGEFPASFTNKTLSFTSNVSMSANLAIKLKWASQPNQKFTGLLKNLGICPTASTLRLANANYEVLENPFETTTSLKVISEEQVPLHIVVMDFTGKVVYESSAHALNEVITLGELFPSGVYVVKAGYGTNLVAIRLIKK